MQVGQMHVGKYNLENTDKVKKGNTNDGIGKGSSGNTNKNIS